MYLTISDLDVNSVDTLKKGGRKKHKILKTEGTKVIRNVKYGETRVKRKHGMACKKWIKLKKEK